MPIKFSLVSTTKSFVATVKSPVISNDDKVPKLVKEEFTIPDPNVVEFNTEIPLIESECYEDYRNKLKYCKNYYY